MLEGTLNDFNFGEIIKLAAATKKTGVIRLRRDDGMQGSVYLRDGYIYFAESNQRRKPIGERLIEAGKLTPAQLQEALKEQERLGKKVRLGMILLDKGFIKPQDLVDAVQEQILETIFQFFAWQEGKFIFVPNETADNEDIGVKLDVENAILKGAEKLEHWKSLRRFIPTLDVVFEPREVDDDAKVIVLRPKELKVLRLVDGERPVREILKKCGIPEFELYKILFALNSAGLIAKKQ